MTLLSIAPARDIPLDLTTCDTVELLNPERLFRLVPEADGPPDAPAGRHADGTGRAEDHPQR